MVRFGISVSFRYFGFISVNLGTALFPKRGNRNTKRTEKHKNKITHGKTYNKSPRRINHKATKSKTNTGTGENRYHKVVGLDPVLNYSNKKMWARSGP